MSFWLYFLAALVFWLVAGTLLSLLVGKIIAWGQRDLSEPRDSRPDRLGL